jgi:hypothetical protein
MLETLEKPRFEDFINPVLAEGFNWFGTLHYPTPTIVETDPPLLRRLRAASDHLAGRQEIKKWQAGADKAATNWIWRIMLRAGEPGRHLLVYERAYDLSLRYHILLGGLSDEKFNSGFSLHAWRQQYDGRAYRRMLDHDRIGGLLRYFVMRVGCPMTVFTDNLNGTFYRGDFFQWTTKGY